MIWGHHYVLGYELHILAVVDWIENTLMPSFFNPSQPCRAGLRIHNEYCPALFNNFCNFILTAVI